MSILVIEVVVRGLWGVIAVPTLALGRWTQGGSGSGRGRGRNLPPSPAPARSGALLLVLVLGRGGGRVAVWMEKPNGPESRSPRDAYQPRQPRRPLPRYSPYYLLLATAWLQRCCGRGREKIDGSRSDHVAIACLP